jgi:hypothetical protein
MTEWYEPTVPRPPIENLDDMITEEQLQQLLGVKGYTTRPWRGGKDGKPSLPYVRFGNQIRYFKNQVAWWMNEWQIAVVDKNRIEHRARLIKIWEKKKPGSR